MGNDKTIRKAPNRIVALVTYAIALVGLLLGLLLPFTGTGDDVLGKMLAAQLPAAINSIYGLDFLADIAAKYPLAFSYKLATWGSFSLDMGAILVILYALVTLMGLVALIPVIANTASKKAKKNIALKAASFIEACAAAVLASLLFMALNYALNFTEGGIASFNCFTVMGAFGGVFLMLAVQAIFYKKGSGLFKLILALLGVLTALVAVYDLAKIIPALADPINGMCANLSWLGTGFIGDNSAISFVNTVVAAGYAIPSDIKLAILDIVGAIVVFIVLLNCVLDIMGMGKKTSRWMLITNIVRYTLEIAAIAIVIIVSAITEGITIGLFSMVIAALAVIAFIINIIRLLTFKSRKKAKNDNPAETVINGEVVVVETRKERRAREKAERRAQKEAQQASKAAETAEAVAEEQPADAPVSVYTNDADGNVVYTPVIYNGPTDDFIRTLNNDQKLEFSRIFLERQADALSCIPDYSVGGKNDKFFASVFIYYSKVRDLVSDGLMNEFYKQANLMK